MKQCSKKHQDRKLQINFSFFGGGKTIWSISKMKLKQTPTTVMPDLLDMVQRIQEIGQSGKRESSINFRMNGDTHSVEENSMHRAS